MMTPTKFTHTINIERLTAGTQIYSDELRCPVEVTGIHFDGYGYMVDFTYGRYGDCEDSVYVDAGGSVEYGLMVGEPVLRDLKSLSVDELDAKYQADLAAIDAIIKRQNARAAEFRRMADAIDGHKVSA